jgi:hypothetical protein
MEYQPLEWEGNIRGDIVEYGIREADSGAVAVSVKIYAREFWNDETKSWEPLEPPTATIGDIWVVKKDGTINTKQVEALCRYAGWDGNLSTISQNKWERTPCSAVVQREEYEDQVRWKISWLNAYDRAPGSLTSLTPDRMAALANKYGSSLRAAAGNAKRNASQEGPGAKPTKDDTPF